MRSDEGGERTAIILAVLEAAARQGVDLRAYLHDILVQISGGIKLERLDELLPEELGEEPKWRLAEAEPGRDLSFTGRLRYN
ncbi:MAG: hypothetical protein GY811_08465 [Myxococcales bacterium]|nr:hypothetical protein [Myxococcales bacterium]